MKNVEKQKRFVRYREGAEMYSMCQSKFEKMAKEAHAIVAQLSRQKSKIFIMN